MNRHQKEYINRINRVWDYVEANLDKELSLETLSEIALFSPFHFHRIFYAFTGETLNDFVKRKRVEKAASLLINNPEDPISNIAYYCGFNSVSVFCRNFKSHFGQSAQEFRKMYFDPISKNRQSESKNGQPTPIGHNYVCNVESLKKIIMNKKIEIKEMPAMNLVYCRHMGSFDKIGETYGKLMQWAGPRGLLSRPDVKTVTVYHDDPNITEIKNVRQSACITVDSPVKTEGEFGNLAIPAGKYVVGSFEIDATQFTESWNSVCVWLSESGYQPDDKNPYELYHNNHEEHPENKFIVDICIPVKPM
jgi:AraC family transcriptional regulator